MSNPTGPSGPIILSSLNTRALYRQVAHRLAQDTDPLAGIVPALGAGADSIYPNYTTDGPTNRRDLTPTPFLIVIPAGKRSIDRIMREARVAIEIHDDPSQGETRWPGLLSRIKWWLVTQRWTPETDGENRFTGGLSFVQESPPDLQDARYDTLLVQLVLGIRCSDSTSGKGYAG